MKPFYAFLILFLLFAIAPLNAQEYYEVEGERLQLKTELEGTVSLYWNTFDKRYRYFAKRQGIFVELKNTKVDGQYNEDYKNALRALTKDGAMDVSKVRLTLAGLRKFFNEFNAKMDPNYVDNSETVKLETRLGIFAGITNHRYTDNPTNESLPLVGLEFEVLDAKMLPRHSVVFGFRQSFKNDIFQYTASQLSLSHRFKFINKPSFAIFLNTKLVTYTYSTTEFVSDLDPTFTNKISGGNLQAPILLGLGADIKLGNGFIILGYNDAVALFIEDNGEFPVDFTLGYKFNL